MGQHFKIITACRNVDEWVARSIQSVQNQTYSNWQSIVVDDCSTDKTREILQEQVSISEKYSLIQNEQRKYQLHNFVDAIKNSQPADEDVIVTLDGDDWFFDENVLSYLVEVYKNPDVWITWGSYNVFPSGKRGSSAQAIPSNYDVRKGVWVFSHLRTFKYFLWRSIKDKDLRTSWSDEYYPMGGDNAFMRPMLEMAGLNHRKFIDRILYVYNGINPLSVRRVNEKLQTRCSVDVKNRNPYSRLVKNG